MLKTIKPELIEFIKQNYKLDNCDLYIEYLKIICETKQEKEIIERILSNALQNNSIVRIKNHLVKQWIVEDYKPDIRNRKEREVREQFSPINWLISSMRKYFNF